MKSPDATPSRWISAVALLLVLALCLALSPLLILATALDLWDRWQENWNR